MIVFEKQATVLDPKLLLHATGIDYRLNAMNSLCTTVWVKKIPPPEIIWFFIFSQTAKNF